MRETGTKIEYCQKGVRVSTMPSSTIHNFFGTACQKALRGR